MKTAKSVFMHSVQNLVMRHLKKLNQESILGIAQIAKRTVQLHSLEQSQGSAM